MAELTLKTKLSTPNLNKLQRLLNEQYSVKLGILGEKAKAVHNDTDLTNVEIGTIHEFGSMSNNIPRRSFLKNTVVKKESDIQKKIRSLLKRHYNKPDGLEKVATLIGIYGEALVQEAFETGGFGTWQPLSQRTIDAKNSSAILIDTGQLRGSISSKVNKL
jgi:phage gpG-like protein